MFAALSQARRRALSWADFLGRIDSIDDWAAMSERDGRHTVARTETVKFVIDLHDDGRTYFLNSSRWFSHYDFVQRFINPRVDYNRFIIVEYTHDDRRFVLGSVMHYLDGDHWTIELDPSDSLAAERVAWALRHVAERVVVATDLRFRPVTVSQAKRIEQLGDRLPVLSRDAINATVEYQPVVLGVAYGYLRLVHGAFDVASVRPYDIVVIDQIPSQIPPVAGLVTSELQAPLAHVAVLSRNRNTPDMALRGAVGCEVFRRFEGELVKLTVSGQDYSVESASLAEAEVAWEAARPRAPFRPERDLRATGLFNVDSLTTGAIHYVGAKAAQLGELGAIEGVATPGGFVLPFSAYGAHLDSAGLGSEIDNMLADSAFCANASVRADRLARLRSAITAQPVDRALLVAIGEKLRAFQHFGRIIFRSSTNAEDLAGFNGAGLYESTVVPANPTAEQIANALRFVWASVWLQRAFEEREWYRIDHQKVAMAVLVQPFIDDAAATGVAITENPYREGRRGALINSQRVGGTVTGATGNEIPEQYLVSTWFRGYDIELIGRSSLTDGALILTDLDVHNLTDILFRIHDAMLPAHKETSNAMDVEFAFTGERSFVILQARPYSVVYNLDRAPPEKRKEGALARTRRQMRKIVHRLLSNLQARHSSEVRLQ